jgi:hypothetical protein
LCRSVLEGADFATFAGEGAMCRPHLAKLESIPRFDEKGTLTRLGYAETRRVQDQRRRTVVGAPGMR